MLVSIRLRRVAGLGLIVVSLATTTLRLDARTLQSDSIATDAEVTALIQRWQNAPADLADLRISSVRIKDGRLFDAVLAVALDGSRGDTIRLQALAVLSSYFNHQHAVSIQRLSSGQVGDQLPIVSDAIGFFGFRTGSVPLPSDVRPQIAEATRDLAAAPGSAAVTHAAQYLRQGFAYLAPEVTPVNLAAFSLTYECGSRFRATNGTGLVLPVVFEFSVSGRRDSLMLDEMELPLRPSERGGIVRLLFVGQEAASLQLGQFPCLDAFDSTIQFAIGGIPFGPPPGAGNEDPHFYLVTGSNQLLKGLIETPNPCYEIAGSFDASVGWQLTVEASENIPPGQLCSQSVTNYEYRARLIGMPPGQHTLTVVHKRDGVVLETFNIVVDVP